jgi:predicted ATPase
VLIYRTRSVLHLEIFALLRCGADLQDTLWNSTLWAPADRRGTLATVLPAPLTSFVGRASELAAVAAAVVEHRLVTLVGPGGSGKSRLAVETARDGPHPLLGFVELSPAGPDTSPPLAVLAGCGVRDDPSVAPGDRLVDHMHDRTGLLVLDNCEHVRTGVAALLHDLLPRCPDLHVLATSRVVLGLVGEAVVPLAGMTTDDAAALFVDRARLVQPRLGEPERGAVAEICRLADGLPLAVELAAARARALSVPAIRDGMADRLRFLTARDPQTAAPYRSLRTSLDRSIELAGGAARRALAALSVVDGRFPLDVALALTGGDRDAVETLVEHSLVQFDAADRRYLLLDTVRDYAAADLVAVGATAQAHGRLLDWAVAFAAEIRAGLERADPEALRRADACDAAVTSALQGAVVAGRGADGALVAADLAFAWSLRGRCAEGLAQIRRLVAALHPVPPPLRWAHAFLAAYSGEMEAGFARSASAIRRVPGTRRTRRPGGHSGSGTAASSARRRSPVLWPSACWAARRATRTPRSPMPLRSGRSRWSPTGWRSWPPSPRTRAARSSPPGCAGPPDVCASSWAWPPPRWSGCWTPPSSRPATRTRSPGRPPSRTRGGRGADGPGRERAGRA